MKLENIKTSDDGKLALDVILIEIEQAGKRHERWDQLKLDFYRTVQHTASLMYQEGKGVDVRKFEDEIGTRYGIIRSQYR